jgi:hypothetical protein
MTDSPESVVRDFIASWENATVEKLSSFLSEDAVYMDPRGIQSGLDAIKRVTSSASIRCRLPDCSRTSYAVGAPPSCRVLQGVWDRPVAGVNSTCSSTIPRRR